MALLATVYTVPRVGSDLSSVETVLNSIAPALSGTESPSTAGWDLPNLDNARVDSWVKLFSTDPKVKSRFALWLGRKSTYEPMISAKLAERDMPQDLIYLAMIESGFNPKAQSPAKAGGLWQFISETGKRYGLTVNKRVDQRNQPEKATDAALSYLSDLHDRFGSWYLAAAAYNTGENRVGRIMKQVTGSEKGTDADYYRISSLLPKETQDYVPMMIAAGRISKEPARYGFAAADAE
jgi:membrane-bound lytic murein transglycosylase D